MKILRFKKDIVRVFYTVVALVLCVFLADSALAAGTRIYSLDDKQGVPLLVAKKDVCKDTDTCIGWHYCSIWGKTSNGDPRTYNFVAFNEFKDLPFFEFKIESDSGYPYGWLKVNFDCNADSCGFSTPPGGVKYYPGSDRNEVIHGGACKYEDPFCCCFRTSKGLLDDCSRAVDYGSGPDPIPNCNAFGNQYKPFTEKTVPQYASFISKGAGCQAMQDAINKAESARMAANKPEAAITKSSINVKQLASSLNQTKFSSAEQVIGQLVKILLSFIGSIALALYIGGAIMWMTSLGNAEKIEKAKNIFVWTTLGVIIMLASYFIVQFLFTTLNV